MLNSSSLPWFKKSFSYITDLKPLFRIINVHFWKSFVGPFFAFAFPLIFVAILGLMLGYDKMFAGFVATPTVAVAMCSMPQAIFEFKQSTLLKRIGSTPIKPWMFLLAAGLYYVVVMIAGTITTMLLSIAIFSGNFNTGREIINTFSMNGSELVPLIAAPLKDVLGAIHWGGFIWANIMNIMVAITLGLLFVSISKTSAMVSGLGIPVLLISGFITGLYLPLAMLKDGEGILFNLGYISPFKGSIGLIQESFSGSFNINPIYDAPNHIVNYQVVMTGSLNIFDINGKFEALPNNPNSGLLTVYGVVDKVLNLILPFVWSAIFVGISIKCFKWSV